ncbi:hypothetical protein ACP4OV_026340 [Aristida adscensionis]
MPSLLDSAPQLPAAGAGGWASLYAVQEPVEPRHLLVPAAAAAKRPACGGRRKNLETCTEALGCETGGVDASPAGDAVGGGEEAECAERKRRPRKEAEEEEMKKQGRAARRRSLPPPLTTLARGAGRVRMVHERRDGRLAVYAVRAPGLEAERSGGRLRMRLLPLPARVAGNAAAAACRREEAGEPEAGEEGEHGGVTMYVVRGGRCVEPEGGAAAARRGGKQWEPEQTAAFLVAATS